MQHAGKLHHRRGGMLGQQEQGRAPDPQQQQGVHRWRGGAQAGEMPGRPEEDQQAVSKDAGQERQIGRRDRGQTAEQGEARQGDQRRHPQQQVLWVEAERRRTHQQQSLPLSEGAPGLRTFTTLESACRLPGRAIAVPFRGGGRRPTRSSRAS